jgi:hypothetical protein
MPIISQLNTANTFSQWLTGTQDLITKVNSFIEGGDATTFYSNTNLSIANNVTIGGDLTVSGNIVLDAIGFDDINANGSANIVQNLVVGGTAVVAGNTTLSNLAVGYTNIETSNVTSLTGSANTLIYSSMAAANTLAHSSIDSANTLIYARISAAEATALAFSIALG